MNSYDYNTTLFFSPLFKNTIGLLHLSDPYDDVLENGEWVCRYKEFIINDLTVLERISLCCVEKNIMTIGDITKENSRRYFNGNLEGVDSLKLMGIDIENFYYGELFIISSNIEITNLKEEICLFKSHLYRFYETDEFDDDVSVLLGLS